MVYLESIAAHRRAPVLPDVDERAARRTLRAQIARLERELAAARDRRLPAPARRPRRACAPPARGCSGSASSSASATTSPAASPTCASRPPARASARPQARC